MKSLKLYLIHQSFNRDYDSFDSAVVAALSKRDARTIHPSGGEGWDESSWVKNAGQVTAELIGYPTKDTVRGVICSSFNAG